jgi:MFS family permease
MTSKGIGITKNKGFYGWIALSGAAFSLLTSNAWSQSFGVFLPVISNEFHWNRATVALTISLANLAIGLPGPIWGAIISRFGPRINIILGNILIAACLAGLYFLHNLWYLYLLFILIGVGMGIGGPIPTTTVANSWFVKRVSAAQSIVAAAVGLAGFVFPPLATALIAAFGWRTAWVILGGIVLIGSTVISGIMLIRNRPEDMGQVPDGEKARTIEVNSKIESDAKKDVDEPKWPIKKILQMPVTWCIFVFGISFGVALGMIFTHQVAYIQDIGFSPMTAATTMSVWAVGSIVGSLAFGALALRINIRHLTIANFIVLLLSMIILLTSRELILLYVYSALAGMSLGAMFPAFLTFIGDYYGRRLYSQVMGFALALHLLAMAISGTVSGAIFDSTGGYTLAFIFVAIFSVVGMVSVFLARKPRLIKINDV